LLCVPVADSRKDSITSIAQIAPTQLADVTEFFRTYQSLEGRAISILGWLDHGAVPDLLARVREAAAKGR
jgi:inorganic pyrophosphatase